MLLSSQAANVLGGGVNTKESVAVVAWLSSCSAECNTSLCKTASRGVVDIL